MQVPEILQRQQELASKGVGRVYVYCVNDGAVMSAWAKEQGIQDSMITFLADPTGEFTKALGMQISSKIDVLGPGRCKRFAMVIQDGDVIAQSISEEYGDPAGDKNPDGPVTALTRVSHLLTLLD